MRRSSTDTPTWSPPEPEKSTGSPYLARRRRSAARSSITLRRAALPPRRRLAGLATSPGGRSWDKRIWRLEALWPNLRLQPSARRTAGADAGFRPRALRGVYPTPDFLHRAASQPSCLLPAKAGSSISRASVSAMDEYALLDRCCIHLARLSPAAQTCSYDHAVHATDSHGAPLSAFPRESSG